MCWQFSSVITILGAEALRVLGCYLHITHRFFHSPPIMIMVSTGNTLEDFRLHSSASLSTTWGPASPPKMQENARGWCKRGYLKGKQKATTHRRKLQTLRQPLPRRDILQPSLHPHPLLPRRNIAQFIIPKSGHWINNAIALVSPYAFPRLAAHPTTPPTTPIHACLRGLIPEITEYWRWYPRE